QHFQIHTLRHHLYLLTVRLPLCHHKRQLFVDQPLELSGNSESDLTRRLDNPYTLRQEPSCAQVGLLRYSQSSVVEESLVYFLSRSSLISATFACICSRYSVISSAT